MEYFAWIEQSGLSTWFRESPSLLAFPLIITLHTIGMGFLVGTSVAMNLCLLGAVPRLPLAPLEDWFPVMWMGFWINALSGIGLLIAYPTKALTNPVFYCKLACITLAMASVRFFRKHVFGTALLDGNPLPRKLRLLAGATIGLWIGALTAGRLLAYTYVRLLANG